MCRPNSPGRDRWTTATTALVVAVLLTAGKVHNLKCRTTDQSKRQGEFIDIAEQCKNQSSSSSSSSSSPPENDYYSSAASYNGRVDRDNGMESGGGQAGKKDGRRNDNREYSVHRQDFNDMHDRGNGNGDRGNGDRYNGDRGKSGNRGNGGDRGYGGDQGYGTGVRGDGDDHRDSVPCDVRSQQFSENNGGRRADRRQGNPYIPSADYDARQSNFNNRQPQQTRRYRRDVYNNNRRSVAAAATMTAGMSRLLGDNRFRNVTKNESNHAKGSIIENMDACTIHCVFSQLEMLNSATSRPDKSSIVNIMTNQIKDVELKEFIQDSIDECFDTLELDSHNTKCEFSKNFAMCMENKAQKNCDDWVENGGQSANKKNSAQDGNNNKQDKRRGY